MRDCRPRSVTVEDLETSVVHNSSCVKPKTQKESKRTEADDCPVRSEKKEKKSKEKKSNGKTPSRRSLNCITAASDCRSDVCLGGESLSLWSEAELSTLASKPLDSSKRLTIRSDGHFLIAPYSEIFEFLHCLVKFFGSRVLTPI
jgi:hypothetical protein